MCRISTETQSGFTPARRAARRLVSSLRALVRLPRRVHGDQRGTISIVSVFTLLMFTMLLILIINVARHLDDKVRMQNAADAAAHSGGVVLARGMNAVAFSNHLLADVFAITAFLREGRDRHAEQLTPEILEAWERNGEIFSTAPYQKFARLGTAIDHQVEHEQRLIRIYGDMTELSSRFSLPVFEYILNGDTPSGAEPLGLIPEFQRTVLVTIPSLSQTAVAEVARRHGLRESDLQAGAQPRGENQRGAQVGVFWRTTVWPVAWGNEFDPLARTLPVVDPDPAQGDYSLVPNPQAYLVAALQQRRELAKHYLEQWNRDKLMLFDEEAELSQFSHLWRILTCARLEELLIDEYPLTNLPMQMRHVQHDRGLEEIVYDIERREFLSRRRESDLPRLMAHLQNEFDVQGYLDREFHFVVTVHRRHLRETGPGLFRNPLQPNSDALAFAQVQVFLPQARRHLVYVGQGGPPSERGLGGTFGVSTSIPLPDQPEPPRRDRSPEDERWPRENWPSHWDMLNQNWTAKLVPATAATLPEILQTNPGGDVEGFRMPNLGNATVGDLKKINTH